MKISVPKNLSKFTRKRLYWPTACNFNKKRLKHRRFPVSFVKFLKTPFFTGHLRTTLLMN